MTGQTNTGGGGIGAQRKGTIDVTYPAGATCTVTNGSQTYTALDTSGAAAFIVEPGTWTVKAVQGSENTSQSVTVTAGGWVEVELSFWNGELYDAGNEFTKYTGGWKVSSVKPDSGAIAQTPKITKNAANIVCASYGLIHPENKMDLTNFSSVVFEGTIVGKPNEPTWLQAGIWTAIGSYFSSNSVVISQITSTVSRVALDCSALTGQYYVGIGRYGDETSITITKAWLE